MKHLALATLAGLALAGASTMALAQNVVPPQNHPNAVVNGGSGAVNPLGPGESAGTAGIGGSATAAPRAPATTGSTTAPGVVVLPPGSSTQMGHPNAVVNGGSGAVNPLGPGESAGTAGIGGSATAAPRQ
jgi:hypothetical protein